MNLKSIYTILSDDFIFFDRNKKKQVQWSRQYWPLQAWWMVWTHQNTYLAVRSAPSHLVTNTQLRETLEGKTLKKLLFQFLKNFTQKIAKCVLSYTRLFILKQQQFFIYLFF